MRGDNNQQHLLESAETVLPTEFGTFLVSAFGFENSRDNLFLVYGNIDEDEAPIVRMHSECITSEVFGSLKCDCKTQLLDAISLIKAEGRGIIIYLRQEGRGIGLYNKIEAYKIQESGVDTINANLRLNLPIDSREYELAYLILKKKGINKIRLFTNNYDKVNQLRNYGIEITDIINTKAHHNEVNNNYIDTKIIHLGHKYLEYDKSFVSY